MDMNRRNFARAAVGMSGLLAVNPSMIVSQSKSREVSSGKINIAGTSLRELREKYRRDLFDDFLPFMDKYVIDHELGGFMCNADYTGERVNGNKLSWFEGRGSWVY